MRINWNTYFTEIAKQVATRSTCLKKHVGAIIVKDNRILTTGYNGSISGVQHCDEIKEKTGCQLDVSKKCIRTIHAEANAILQAAKYGISINGADIYVTHQTCWNCFKLIANVGIKYIFLPKERLNVEGLKEQSDLDNVFT